MNEITVRFPDGQIESLPFGARAGIAAERYLKTPLASDTRLVALKLNNELVHLQTRLEVSAELKPVYLDSADGALVYRRSLCFLLTVAARELYPERPLVVGHSLGNGYYYTFDDESPIKADQTMALETRMREIVAADETIRFRYIAYQDALDLFADNGQQGTALLLDQLNSAKVPVNECRGFIDLSVAPLAPRTGLLQVFELRTYGDGLLLRYPHIGARQVSAFEDSPRIFSVYKEYKTWGKIVGVNAVGHLNRLIADRKIMDFIQIAEAFQSKKLQEIANQIYERRDEVRVLLIAGPSSSGKTTTAKRLSILLKVMGLEPVAIGLDDYFLGREKTPLNEKGEPDYEGLEALDVPYLNEQLLALFKGETVSTPIFDFKAGARRTEGRTLKLNRGTILIIEGIHGLNDALTPQIPRERKFKLYASALTQLNLDDHNRISTSDNRLIRRLVRDNQFRSHNAVQTIKMWPNVQKGEKKHIFPFQDSADAAFNSALDYELAVLKVYAEPLLRSVKPTMNEYTEAARLISFLANFSPLPPQHVPSQSILREFIGESEFKY